MSNRLTPAGREAIIKANKARGFGVKGSELSKKQAESVKVSNKTRNNKTPARIKAGLERSEANATKLNRLMIARFKYIMANLPDPLFVNRQAGATDKTLPIRVGLTRGRVLSVHDQIELTMAALTVSKNNNVNDTACIFTKRIKEFLPGDVYPGIDIFYHEERANEAVKKVIEEYREWVVEYMAKCERKLAGMYLAIGKWQSPYLEVLQRRFRDNWSTQQRVDLKADVKAEEKVDATINFNFTTVPGKVEVPNGSQH